jgi:cell division protein FtsI/penicillin-binding protein 2
LKNIRIIIFLFVFLIVAFLSLVGRCFYLQLVKGDHYTSVSTKQLQGWFMQQPQRGVILDSRGRMLAASNRIRTIYADPRIIKDPEEVSSKLAPIVDMGADLICKLIVDRKDSRYTRIKIDADPNECNLVLGRDPTTGKKKGRRVHPGIGVEVDSRRHYPMGDLAAHIVGFTSDFLCRFTSSAYSPLVGGCGSLKWRVTSEEP